MTCKKLSDISSKNVISINSSRPLQEALDLMYKHNIRNVVVVDQNSYKILLASNLLELEMENTTLDKLLSELELLSLELLPANSLIIDGIKAIKNQTEHIGLIENDTLVGIVSYSDIIKNLDPKVLAQSQTIGEILHNPDVLIVGKNTTLKELIPKIAKNKYKSAIVEKDGIITQKDIITILKNGINTNALVSTVMNQPLFTIKDTLNIEEAIEISRIKKYKRLIVEGTNGQIIGIVTQKDLASIYYNQWYDALKEHQEELAQKNEELTQYISIVDKNVIYSSTNLDGEIIYVSEAFANVIGYEKDELIGQNHRIIKDPNTSLSLYNDMWETIVADEIWASELKIIRKDGSHLWMDVIVSPVFDKNGVKIGYTAIRQNITDKKIIEELSITDGLTNIFNRRHFNEFFPKIISGAKRNDELVCFLLMDIDHFKQYNDNYGHQAGDDVLIKFGQSLKETLKRAGDLPFRLGGEEFGVVFKSETKEKALEFANTIRENIENLHIEHKYNSASPYITASMGLVCKNGNIIKDMDEVYKEADDLLYESKEGGRNRVSINKKEGLN